MTTIENIHNIIEQKILLTEEASTIMFNSTYGNKDSVFDKNLKDITHEKNNLDCIVDEYLINSADYLYSYKSLIANDLSANESADPFPSGIIEAALITELLHIFRSNEYVHKSSKTFGSVDNRVQKRKIYDNYKAYVRKCNIVDALNLFMTDLFWFNRVYVNSQDLVNKYDAYNRTYLSLGKVGDVVYDVCECGTKMIIQSSTSELLCSKCGFTVNLIGSVTEEAQLFAQEGNRVSHGSYDPARHCKFWIERIQAKENTVIPKESIARIRRSIQKDYPDTANYKNISVKQFRAYLKQNNLSKLNDHIPLIKKIITGHVPPQLSFKEHQLLFIYFDKAARTYEKIKPFNKKNSLYYPFLIYKILELIIDNKDKRDKLLDCIHLQSYETLIDNDRIWFDICQKNDCFSYKATDRYG